MKSITYRRIRRTASHDAPAAKKESQQEQSFFGTATPQTFFQPAPAIQRKCDGCAKEEKMQRVTDKNEEEKLQKKDAAGSSNGTVNVSSYINSLNGKGNPLPSKANDFFSARMGYDFSNVKVHTDKDAAESAKAVNAKAYTVGNNIVFNQGQYNGESGEGKKLMAHELAHVVQNNNNIHRKAPGEETPVTAAGEEHGEEGETVEGKEGVFTCNPVGLDRATFLTKPNTKGLPLGITGPPTVSMSPLSLEKYKRKFILKPAISSLNPVPSFFTKQGGYMEGKEHFGGTTICQGEALTTYPVKWVITADGEAKIKEAELEHCADIKHAFDLTLGMYTEKVNFHAKKKTLFKDMAECKKVLKKDTKVDPDQWLEKFKETVTKTKLRDDAWHIPAPIIIAPHKIKDPLYQCDYFEKKITANSLKEVGNHPSSDIITI